MATWTEFSTEAPELAAAIAARFTANKHHVLATLRRDGSPRVSGTEVEFADGVLRLGSMPGARKARDLQRDPRYALHANPSDETMAGGDAKVSGTAREVTGDELDRIVAGYPEQVRDAKHSDLRCDLYALGGVLYHRVAGRPPFEGRNLLDLIQAEEKGLYTPLRRVVPQPPEALDRVLGRLLARRPEMRYGHCEELIDDLLCHNLAGERLSFIQ